MNPLAGISNPLAGTATPRIITVWFALATGAVVASSVEIGSAASSDAGSGSAFSAAGLGRGRFEEEDADAPRFLLPRPPLLPRPRPRPLPPPPPLLFPSLTDDAPLPDMMFYYLCCGVCDDRFFNYGS